MYNIYFYFISKYQPRLSYDLLSSLAGLLLDDTVLQIVAELADLQHMTERRHHQARSELLARHRGSAGITRHALSCWPCTEVVQASPGTL